MPELALANSGQSLFSVHNWVTSGRTGMCHSTRTVLHEHAAWATSEGNQKSAAKDRPVEEPCLLPCRWEQRRQDQQAASSARATASASPAQPSAYGISEKSLKAELFRKLTVHCSSSPINWRAEACNRSAKHRQQQLESTGALTAEVSGTMTVSTLKNVSLYIYGLGFFWTRSQRYVWLIS